MTGSEQRRPANVHIVARVDEIPPGSRKIVELDGREIGVFNVDGAFFAVRNRCPHMAGPLCDGYVSGALTSTAPGEYQFEPAGTIIRCPWHQWEFDMRTGQSWFDPSLRVRSYQATVTPGAALLAQTATPPIEGMLPGPYVAEIYPVTVEHDYVVVDLSRR